MASIEYREGDDVHCVTLGDVSSGININKELVRLGLATTHTPAPRDAKRFQKPIQQLLQAQDEAKKARLALWRFGDLLDQEEQDE